MSSRVPLYVVGALTCALAIVLAFFGSQTVLRMQEGDRSAPEPRTSLLPYPPEPTLRPDLFQAYEEKAAAETPTPAVIRTATPASTLTPTPPPPVVREPVQVAPEPRFDAGVASGPVAPPLTQPVRSRELTAPVATATVPLPRPPVVAPVIVPTVAPRIASPVQPQPQTTGRIFAPPTLTPPQVPPWLLAQQNPGP
jgi:hypothetical protein